MKINTSYSTKNIKQHRNIVLLMLVAPVLIFSLVAISFTGGNSVKSNIEAQVVSPVQFGYHANADITKALNSIVKGNGKLVRIEFGIGSSTSSIRPYIADAASKNMEVVMLAGFHGRLPSVSESQNLANWAREFGPGGTFWLGRTDGHLAARYIEFGNETSYSYQGTQNRGQEYGQRFNDAYNAIKSANSRVGLLAQADDGNCGCSTWVNGMFSANPAIATQTAGWTVHPYGPRSRWEPRVDRLIAQTAARGASNSIPIFITEYGFATDNGATLTDNYSWPKNMTYQQAAENLRKVVVEMKAKPGFGNRLSMFFYYQAHDQKPSGTGEREHYFGIVKNDQSEKVPLTGEARTIANAHPPRRSGSVIAPPPSSPSPTPPPSSPAPTYNFAIEGTAMKWGLVPGATGYKVYLADTKTYIHLSATTTSYSVPPPTTGSTRQVGWTWYDGQDHWVTEKVLTFASSNPVTPPPPLDPTPTPTPTENPNVPEVIVVRPSDPPPLITIPDADGMNSVPIPAGAPANPNGQITGDFNADGLNDLAFDLNNDGRINPDDEIVISGADEPNLTDTSTDPIILPGINNGLEENAEDQSGTLTITAGPLPDVKIPKPVAYTFFTAGSATLVGIGAYLAFTKLAIFASIRGKWGI